MPTLHIPLIIGLGHKARQGKNIVVEAMQEHMKKLAPKLDVRAYALADELKRYCVVHHDALYAKYPNISKNKKEDLIYGFTGMLQWYGTNVIREQAPNHWIECLQERLDAEAPDIAIISDIRFQNEAEWIKSKSTGFLVEVIRLTKDSVQYLDPKRDPKHASEVDLDGYRSWDYVLTASDGELDKLRKKAEKVLTNIFIDFAVKETKKDEKNIIDGVNISS